MSAKLTGRPFLTALKRRLSAQAQAVYNESIETTGLQVSKSPNGVALASLASSSPLSRIALVVNAGPRFERHDQLGITHCIRVAADQCTKPLTAFEVANKTLQMGANINCTTTRENFIYSLDCSKDSVHDGMSILMNIVTQQALHPWEVQDVQAKLRVDSAIYQQQPQSRLLELLHKVAYGDSLGRSLYAPDFMIGNYNSEMLMEYLSSNFTANRMALVGIGVDHSVLTRCAKRLPNNSGSTSATSTTSYRGGECHVDSGGDLAYAAVVTEGASIGSKDVIALALLQQVMGCGPRIKRLPGCARLEQAAGQATSQPHAVSCINLNYSDSGLFGFYAVTQASDMAKVLKGMFSQFSAVSKSGVTDQEVQRARTSLKSSLLMQAESTAAVIQDISEQLVSHGSVQQGLSKLIDSVSTQDVHNVAKRVITGKATMVATGSLGNTPYLDDLM